MSEAIKISHVELHIKDVVLKLTVEELRKLSAEIDTIIGRVPAAPIIITPPATPSYPSTSPFWYQQQPYNVCVDPNSDEWPNNWGFTRGPIGTSGVLKVHA